MLCAPWVLNHLWASVLQLRETSRELAEDSTLPFLGVARNATRYKKHTMECVQFTRTGHVINYSNAPS